MSVGTLKAPLGMLMLVAPSCTVPPKSPTSADVVEDSLVGHSMSDGPEFSLRDDEPPGAVARPSPHEIASRSIARVKSFVFAHHFERSNIAACSPSWRGARGEMTRGRPL